MALTERLLFQTQNGIAVSVEWQPVVLVHRHRGLDGVGISLPGFGTDCRVIMGENSFIRSEGSCQSRMDAGRIENKGQEGT